MRLPARFQKRGWFAIGALLTGSVFSGVFYLLVFRASFVPREFVEFLVLGLFAAPAAWLCLPRRTDRDVSRMAWAGLLTVLIAFLFFAAFLAFGIAFFEGHASFESQAVYRERFLVAISLLPGIFLFGSLMTLGIPYIIGAIAAMLFVEE